MIRFEEDKRLTPLSAALAAALACLVPLGLPPVSRHHASAVALANKNSQNLLQLNAFQVFPSKRARAEAEPGGPLHHRRRWEKFIVAAVGIAGSRVSQVPVLVLGAILSV